MATIDFVNNDGTMQRVTQAFIDQGWDSTSAYFITITEELLPQLTVDGGLTVTEATNLIQFIGFLVQHVYNNSAQISDGSPG
jgi:hypothetical protein